MQIEIFFSVHCGIMSIYPADIVSAIHHQKGQDFLNDSFIHS